MVAEAAVEEGSCQLLAAEEDSPVAEIQPRPWRRPLVGTLLGAAVLLVAGTAIGERSAAPSTRHILAGAAVLLAESAGKPKCAKADSEDCTKSQCCQDIGFQCFAKTDGWAVCKESCDKDEMKKYDPKHEAWTCKALGERNECAKEGEDCSKRGCCAEPGSACFQKSKFWAVCMPGCDAAAMKKNDPKNETWSCNQIGERNFESTCTWAGQDCSKTKCCNNNGFTCAQKDANYAGCQMTEKKSTWFSEDVPLPANWDGKILGGGRGEYEVQAVPEGQPIATGNSLFCVMVYLPNSTEESLMWLAQKNRQSVFGCNATMTLHSWQSQGAGWDTGETTLMNTNVFLDAFERIRKDGRYMKYDWLVKADPDCVFFADRLMNHLWALRAPPYTPIYIKNNGVDAGLGNNGFLGAIEIFSKAAMQTYFANWEGCKKYLGEDSGEDGFFKGCMDALGVGFMTDTNIFTPDYDPSACRNEERVAFHPIKVYNEWQCCVDIVYGIERNPVYGKCEDGSKIKRSWIKEE